MNRMRTIALAALAILGLSGAAAHAGVFIGIGVPGPYYRPYRHRYYRPRIVIAAPPVVVAPVPARVYVAPAPVYVQPAPTVLQAVPQPVIPVPVR